MHASASARCQPQCSAATSSTNSTKNSGTAKALAPLACLVAAAVMALA
jgi:hypothetical protein